MDTSQQPPQWPFERFMAFIKDPNRRCYSGVNRTGEVRVCFRLARAGVFAVSVEGRTPDIPLYFVAEWDTDSPDMSVLPIYDRFNIHSRKLLGHMKVVMDYEILRLTSESQFSFDFLLEEMGPVAYALNWELEGFSPNQRQLMHKLFPDIFYPIAFREKDATTPTTKDQTVDLTVKMINLRDLPNAEGIKRNGARILGRMADTVKRSVVHVYLDEVESFVTAARNLGHSVEQADIDQLIVNIVAHNVGHAFNLKHNFNDALHPKDPYSYVSTLHQATLEYSPLLMDYFFLKFQEDLTLGSHPPVADMFKAGWRLTNDEQVWLCAAPLTLLRPGLSPHVLITPKRLESFYVNHSSAFRPVRAFTPLVTGPSFADERVYPMDCSACCVDATLCASETYDHIIGESMWERVASSYWTYVGLTVVGAGAVYAYYTTTTTNKGESLCALWKRVFSASSPSSD